jgi:hypothetical protein
MSKRKIDITKNVMSKIKTERIKMKPKWYFLVGSLSIVLALVSLIIVSIFLISLITFSLKSHGPMGAIRYQQIISNFPWWAPIIVIVGLVTGIILLKKYDFSYKKSFLFIVTVFISAVLLAGILIDILGFDNLWIKRGPMKKFYQQYNSDYKQEWNNNTINNSRGRRNFK